MRILLLSAEGDGIGLVKRLCDEGHTVAIWIKADSRRLMWDGMVSHTLYPHVAPFVPDLVVCDTTGLDAHADAWRRRNVPVFGGHPLGTRLERDRMYALHLARECGIRVPKTIEFQAIAPARRFLTTADASFVLKLNGNVDTHTSFVGDRNDDVIAALEKLKPTQGFILQEKVESKKLELNTELWFSGGKPLPFGNGGMEQKKFLAGDMGWNTGCESYLVWGYDDERPLAVQTAFPPPLLAVLRDVAYSGPLDVAMLMDEDDQLWMTEFTPRMGYSSIYAMLALMPDGFDFGHFLHAIAVGNEPTLEYQQGVAAAITISVPPYPYDIPKLTGFRFGINADNLPEGATFWPIDVAEDPKRGLVTGGTSGLTGYVTVTGPLPADARWAALEAAAAFETSSKQYRTDAVMQEECCYTLESLGYHRFVHPAPVWLGQLTYNGEEAGYG